MVNFIPPSVGPIDTEQLIIALTIDFLYIVFSWMYWKRAKRKLTLWLEITFRGLFPAGIAFIFIFFFENLLILSIALPALIFFKISRSGKLWLMDRFSSTLGNKLVILNEVDEEPNDEYTDLFEDSSAASYDVADIMAKNAKRLGEDVFKGCEEIIKSMEGGVVNVYYMWMMVYDKFEYVELLYLHPKDPNYKVPKVLNMNNVELEPIEIDDRHFRVFFGFKGDRNEEALVYLKKWKRVYETAKILPDYDDYIDLQDKYSELEQRYVDRRREFKKDKGWLKGEDKEKDDY